MVSKIIKAKLREPVEVGVRTEIDFSDWITASALVERARKELFAKLKDELHMKIATLDINDLEFKVIET